MKIYMVAAESRPFSKTGGLADVVYSLSSELVKKGESVSIFTPLYQGVKEQFKDLEKINTFLVAVGWRQVGCDVYFTKHEDIRYFFIDGHYFHRDQFYGFDDDGERFAFFTLAVKELLYQLMDIPDIIHIHDWHVGMLPCLIKEDEYANNYFKKTKFVFSIHNPAFQGLLDASATRELYGLPYSVYENGSIRFKGGVSTLKAAIVYSDKITTVSPNHRYELLTPEGGMGLDGVLRFREYDFVGILNGIDYDEFNPREDKLIFENYNANDYFRKKNKNKLELMRKLNIYDYGKPLFSLVTRLTWQKGLDIALPALEEMLKQGCSAVVLGSGEYRYEQWLEDLRKRYPKNLAIYIGYNDALAHQIYAASDIVLVPSLFEPCGLTQMIAQRYGALPLVRRTGGLKDSVVLYDGTNEGEANGFGFDYYNQHEINQTCQFAYNCWENLPLRKQLMKNALLTDNSWQKSADEYYKIYLSIINK